MAEVLAIQVGFDAYGYVIYKSRRVAGVRSTLRRAMLVEPSCLASCQCKTRIQWFPRRRILARRRVGGW